MSVEGQISLNHWQQCQVGPAWLHAFCRRPCLQNLWKSRSIGELVGLLLLCDLLSAQPCCFLSTTLCLQEDSCFGQQAHVSPATNWCNTGLEYLAALAW